MYAGHEAGGDFRDDYRREGHPDCVLACCSHQRHATNAYGSRVGQLLQGLLQANPSQLVV